MTSTDGIDSVTPSEARGEAARLLRKAEECLYTTPGYSERYVAMADVWARLACDPNAYADEAAKRKQAEADRVHRAMYGPMESRGHQSIPGAPSPLDGMASLRSDD